MQLFSQSLEEQDFRTSWVLATKGRYYQTWQKTFFKREKKQSVKNDIFQSVFNLLEKVKSRDDIAAQQPTYV